MSLLRADQLSQTRNDKPIYEITASLLNSFYYLWHFSDYVSEGYSDRMKASYEQRLGDAYERAKVEFLNSLNRIHTPTTPAQQRGMDFEDACCAGKVPVVSEIIENGVFQPTYYKLVKVDGLQIQLKGRLDVLKAGTVYDMKRVSRWHGPEHYKKSVQHWMYLELVPEASQFIYLINDGYVTHFEIYHRYEAKPVEPYIHEFIQYLKSQNLLDIYLEKWNNNRRRDLLTFTPQAPGYGKGGQEKWQTK